MHDAQRSRVQRRAGTIVRISFLKYFFLLPAVLWVVAFSIFPLFSALRYSLANYVLGRGITSSDYRQLMVHIALPLAWPVLSVALLLRLVEALQQVGGFEP